MVLAFPLLFGWHLLRKCGLTKEQRQLVTLRAPQLELTKNVEALYLISQRITTKDGTVERVAEPAIV